jgi:hypothetical protein
VTHADKLVTHAVLDAEGLVLAVRSLDGPHVSLV